MLILLILFLGLCRVTYANDIFNVDAYRQRKNDLSKISFKSATELISMAEKTNDDAEKTALCARIYIGWAKQEFKNASGQYDLHGTYEARQKSKRIVRDVLGRFPQSLDLLQLGLVISGDGDFMPYFLAAYSIAMNPKDDDPEIVLKVREGFFHCLGYMVDNFPLRQSPNYPRSAFVYDFNAKAPDAATVQMWVALLQDYANNTTYQVEEWQELIKSINEQYPTDKNAMDVETARRKLAMLIPQYVAYCAFGVPVITRIKDESHKSYRDGEESGKRAAYAEVSAKLPRELPARIDKAEYERLLADVITVSNRWEPHSVLCEFMVKNALVYTFDEYPPLKYGDPKKSDVLKIAAAWYDFRRMRDRKQNSATTIAICDEVLKRDPKDVNAAALKAVACVYREDFPAARRALAQAEKLGLNDKDFLHQMAKNLVAQSAARQRAKEK